MVGYKIDFTTSKARKKQIDCAVHGPGALPASSPAEMRTRAPSSHLSKVKAPLKADMDRFLAALHATGDGAVLLSAYPEYAEDYQDPVWPVLLPPSLKCLFNAKTEKMTDSDLAAYCKTVADRVQFDVSQALKVERETRGQHRSPLWLDIRV